MRMSSFPIFFFSLPPLLFLSSHCTTILVDGSSELKNSTIHIGDSIIFKHKQHYNIYNFQNQKALDLCNFIQATLLTNPNTNSYTWLPSRPGLFYFSFKDGSLKACQASQKLAINVTLAPAATTTPQASAVPPELSPLAAPAPSSGADVSSSSPPLFPWPFLPPLQATPSASSPVAVPFVPEQGSSMPFINSNPAVPLPTGEVDSATIHPLPTSENERQVMIGSSGFMIAMHSITLLLL